ncbi:MAG: ABC transporter permease [Abditibacteriota bacterium]|nr:ABC transporter permease [Abditibacteriota bacterium]
MRIGKHIKRAAKAPAGAWRSVKRFFELLGESFIIIWQVFTYVLRGRVNLRDAVGQMCFMGVESLVIILITVAFSSAVIALYLAQIITGWGFGSYTGSVIGLAITREIAPVLCGVVLSARVASSIGAEIGSMVVTEQIDALKTLSVDPVEYLVVPKVVAAVIMLPLVGVLADAVGIGSGYLVACANGVSGGGFMAACQSFTHISDLLNGLIKCVVFGLAVSVIGSQQGLRTRGGAVGVGEATTNSVVISIVVVYITNFLMTYVMFGGKGL